ncbi:MAG: zinc ribbon domain-containing protein [Clostridia bacterium]|nr:zinc ribbon domain-containing protein [Clostridia bacterium]
MRRDICYYFPTDVRSVYNAFLTAATNPTFRRNCTQEPYHTISFGMNFSFKFNITGGSCTIHFIPYQDGTAVDLRFSLVQAFGARYGAYAQQLVDDVSKVLGNVQGVRFNVDINEFLKEENKVKSHAGPVIPQPMPTPPPPQAPVTPQPVQAPVIPQPMQTPQPQAPEPIGKICTGCGVALSDDDVFCRFCGTKADTIKACPGCGNTDIEGSAFCNKCGTKLD